MNTLALIVGYGVLAYIGVTVVAAVVRGVRDGLASRRAKPEPRESLAADYRLAECRNCGPTYTQIGVDGLCSDCYLPVREARAIYRTLTR